MLHLSKARSFTGRGMGRLPGWNVMSSHFKETFGMGEFKGVRGSYDPQTGQLNSQIGANASPEFLERYARGRMWQDYGVVYTCRRVAPYFIGAYLVFCGAVMYAKSVTPRQTYWKDHTFKCAQKAGHQLPKALTDDTNGVKNAEEWRFRLKGAALQFTGVELHIANLQGALQELERGVALGEKKSCSTLKTYLAKWGATKFLDDSDMKWPADETFDQLEVRLYEALLPKLDAAGLFTMRDRQKILDDARFPFCDHVIIYGKDVAHPVTTTYQYDDDKDEDVCTNGLSLQDEIKVCDAIEKSGGVLLTNYSLEKKLDEIRKIFKIQRNWVGGGKTFVTSGVSSEVFETLDPTEMMIVNQATRGRRHHLLRDTPLKELVEDLQKGYMPIVQRYMQRSRKHSIIQGNAPHIRMHLSECQFVVCDPLAGTQFFHANTSCPGITVTVPLVDLGTELGVEQFFPGTHKAVGRHPSVLRHLPDVFRRAVGLRAPVCVKQGVSDILITDGRVVHRGLANTSFQSAGCYLIFRYDFSDAPPPAMGSIICGYVVRLGRRTIFHPSSHFITAFNLFSCFNIAISIFVHKIVLNHVCNLCQKLPPTDDDFDLDEKDFEAPAPIYLGNRPGFSKVF